MGNMEILPNIYGLFYQVMDLPITHIVMFFNLAVSVAFEIAVKIFDLINE